MHRRRYLSLTATAAAISLAGCSGDDGPGGPADAMQQFVDRNNEGDVEGVNELIADDGDIDPLTEEDAAFLEEVEVEATNIEVLSEDEESAEVEVVLRFTQGDSIETDTRIYELRVIDGEWRFWDSDVEN